MMVWSTGVESLDFIKELNCPHDEVSGRILTDSKLRVIGEKDVYSIGDCAMIENQFYPPTAQVADQMSEYLANKIFNEGDTNTETADNFKYLNKGSMAQLGDGRAVMDLREVGSDQVPKPGNTSSWPI